MLRTMPIIAFLLNLQSSSLDRHAIIIPRGAIPKVISGEKRQTIDAIPIPNAVAAIASERLTILTGIISSFHIKIFEQYSTIFDK